MNRLGPRTPRETGTHLRRRPWLKLSSQSLSPEMSKPSCCGSLWPTLLVVVIGQGMLPLQQRPPTATSWPLIRCSSPRQESLLRPTIDFVQSSPSLGSYVVRRCRKLSSPHNSYMVMPAHGETITPPLTPRTTKCRGLSSAVLSVPTTSQHA
jgi:hypothetical protein